MFAEEHTGKEEYAELTCPHPSWHHPAVSLYPVHLTLNHLESLPESRQSNF